MKIAIDVSPLHTGHKVRGVGFYLHHLQKALVTYHKEHEYIFFTNHKELSSSVDIVHYPYFDPFFITLPFKKNTPTIVTVHDLIPIIFPQHFPAGIMGNVRWQIQKYLLRQVNGIITDSHSSKNDISRYTGITEQKVDVVYLAAGEEFRVVKNGKHRLEQIKKKYDLPEEFVLYVGDVTWNKNLPRLIEAIKKVKLPLVMVGKALINTQYDADNPWNNDLHKIHTLCEGEKNILRLGFVDQEELILLYNSATVTVLPSYYEGFGLTVLEAMACGSPVITTKNGSLPEVAGEAVYFVDAYDTESIGKGIEAVYNDKSLREKMRLKGFAQVEKFTWKETARKTVEVYKSVYRR